MSRLAKERLDAFIGAHIPLLCFFMFFIFSFIGLIIFQTKALKDMKRRNDRILSHYEQVLSLQSKDLTIEDMNLDLYIKEFKFTPSQSLAFQDYSKRIVESAVAQSQVDMEVSAIVEAKAETMYQETKDLLEMEFAKIQQETESLQIWCGILTIVFLIFSFYSLFKTDELVQQGRDGVKELASLQEKGNQSIENLKQKGQQKIIEFEKESTESLRKASIEKQSIEGLLEEKKESAISEVTQKVSDGNKLLDDKYQSLASALDSKIREYDEKVDIGDNIRIEQMIASMESLRNRVEELERLRVENNG